MAQANTDLVLAVKKELKGILPQIDEALPATAKKYMTKERIVKVALMAIRKTPKLLQCNRASILEAVMDMASLGLELGGALGHAYLVPFKTQAVPIIGYRGYIALARRSGEIESVKAEIVHQHDDFDIDLASGQPPTHKPCLKGNRGDPEAVYCVARFKDGGMHVEYMTVDDVKKIQARSPSVRANATSPWDTDWNEMAKKTVVRRAAKYWPLSIEMADAIEVDNRTDGVSYSPSEIITPDTLPEAKPETRTDQAIEALKKAPAPADEHIHQGGHCEMPDGIVPTESTPPPAEPHQPPGHNATWDDEKKRWVKKEAENGPCLSPTEPEKPFTQEYPRTPEEQQQVEADWNERNTPTGNWNMERLEQYYVGRNLVTSEVFLGLKRDAGITKDKRRDSPKKRDELISALEQFLDKVGIAKKDGEDQPHPADEKPVDPHEPTQTNSDAGGGQTDMYKKPAIDVRDETVEHGEIVKYVQQMCFEADPQVTDKDILLMIAGVTGKKHDKMESVSEATLRAFVDARNKLALKTEKREPGEEG